MAASRKGRPAIGLQTLINRMQKKAEVSVEDAEQAAQVLQRSRGRAVRYRDAMIAGGVFKPLAKGIGRAAESALTAPKGYRLQAAMHGYKDVKGGFHFKTPGTVRDVIEGGFGGAAVNAGREGLEIGRARRKAEEFVRSTPESPKVAALTADPKKKIRPLPFTPLNPIVDNEIEFEV